MFTTTLAYEAEKLAWWHAVLDAEDKIAARLAFSDWLRDHGDPHADALQITHVEVIGRRWFDRRHGNTYHTVTVATWWGANEGLKSTTSRITYGYGHQYEETAAAILEEMGAIPGSEFFRLAHRCEEAGIVCQSNHYDVKRKRDL